MTNTVDYRSKYGAWETNGLEDPNEYHNGERKVTVHFDDKRLKTITRLRLISDPGYPMWDVSYCHGVLKDGTEVRVTLDNHQFNKRTIKGDLIAMCKRRGVFAKGIGLLNDGNWSKCQ